MFPYPPEDPDDKMTSFDHLTITGTAHYLANHLGNRETTLEAFGVDPDAYRRSNAYVISEQGNRRTW